MSTKLLYPPKESIQKYNWYHLQAPPPGSSNKFALPNEQGRVMWLYLTADVASILIQHGWKVV